MTEINRRAALLAAVATGAGAVLLDTPEAQADESLRIWAAENKRNADSAQLFKDMFAEVYKPDQFVAAHHLISVKDGVNQEFPSADMFIFDHEPAAVLWGPNYRTVLAQLAMEPIATRDTLLAKLYYGRPGHQQG
jgi:hypothetical protein